MGFFEVEAMGLQGGKQGLDVPALGVSAQRRWGIGIAGDQQPLFQVRPEHPSEQ